MTPSTRTAPTVSVHPRQHRHPRAARLTWLFLSVCVGLSGLGSGSAGAAADLDEEASSEVQVHEVSARQEEGRRDDASRSFRTEYRVTQGYRMEELDWSIGIPTINVLSELKWEEMQSTFTRLEAMVMLPGRFYLHGDVQHGWIIDGENQDSDYLLPNRQAEFSRSNNQSDVGDFSGFSVGLGYHTPPVHFWGESYEFGLSFGYAHREQNLVIRDGFQTIPALGAFAGLRSKYDTRWLGPWIGVEIVGRSPVTSLTFTGAVQYHMLYYEGVADWNLRTDLAHPKSFEHDAHGDGLVARLAVKKDIREHLFLELGVEWSLFSTDTGDDITNFATGTSSEIDLNEVNWTAFSAKLTFGARF